MSPDKLDTDLKSGYNTGESGNAEDLRINENPVGGMAFCEIQEKTGRCMKNAGKEEYSDL